MTVDGAELCLETFGDRAAPAILLIGGAAASMDWWDAEFCELLAARGRFVIRYDHRDTGRSVASPVGAPTYSAADLTRDPIRILDGLGLDRAHVVGVSMGGGIAQELALRDPGRLLTMTLIATSPIGTRGDPTPLPPMDPRIAAVFGNPAPEPAWDDRAAVLEYLVDAERDYEGPRGFDEAWVRRVVRRIVDRSRDLRASLTNHDLVIAAEQDGDELRLADVTVPALVLHGTDDPLFPLPHGTALAAEIPGAAFVALEGMGHQVPPPRLWEVVVSAITRHTAPR
ncbi:pimeloyl-ACP methyl ester carboxylesterase [Prauserella muralis]|nr:pimeloyl-ACP methyl ester carboxylesterase [Prauserella muralis]